MSNFGDIFESRHFTKGKSVEDDWNFDEEGSDVHTDFFAPLLDGRTLDTLAGDLRYQNGSLRVLNVLGGLKVLKDLHADSGACIRLKDQRDALSIEKDIDQGLEVVTGDILSRSTWRKVPAENDLILELGQGALYSLPIDNIDVYFFLIKEMFQRLAVNGIIFAQAPSFAFDQVSSWIDTLNTGNYGVVGSYFTQSDNGVYCGFSLAKLADWASLST